MDLSFIYQDKRKSGRSFEEKGMHMEWAEIWTIIGGIVAGVVAIGTFLRNFKIDLKEKIDGLKNNLEQRIDDQSKRIDELSAKIDRNETKLNNKLDALEKDLIQMNTKTAVIESRLSDISTNLTHLMWHSQTIPSKQEANES